MGVVAEAVGVLLVQRVEDVVPDEHKLDLTALRQSDAELQGPVEQEVRVGRIGDEVLVGVEARLLRHVEPRERERAVVLTLLPEAALVGPREPIAVGGHEGQPAATRPIAR